MHLNYFLIICLSIFFATGCASTWVIKRTNDMGVIGYKNYSSERSAEEAIRKLIHCPNYKFVQDEMKTSSSVGYVAMPTTTQTTGTIGSGLGSTQYTQTNSGTQYVPTTYSNVWREFTYQCENNNLDSASLVPTLPTETSAKNTQELSPEIQNVSPNLPEYFNPIEEGYSIGFGIRNSSTLTFHDTVVVSDGDRYVDDLVYESNQSSLVLVFDYRKTQSNSWGWGSGASYLKVEWDEVFYKTAYGTVSGSTTVLSTYINAIYRWESVFFPIGLNFSFLSHKDVPDFLAKNGGNIGSQIGLGFIVDPNFTFIIQSKNYGFTGAIYRDGDDKLESESGYLNGLEFVGLFKF